MKARKIVVGLILAWAFHATVVRATPSSTFWTVCTTDIQPVKTLHFGCDNYFTVFNRRGHGQFLATDIGLEYGLFSWHDLSAEVGIDTLCSTDDPWFFNAKLGLPEGKLCRHAPAVNVGIFNVGTRTRGRDKTNQNIVDLLFGKSLPEPIGGSLFVGAFSGASAMGRDRQGFMVAFERGFCPAKDDHGKEYKKWTLLADYASGKNAIGGGGVGLCYCFTPDVSVLTGPVFFNDAKFNGSWKWALQIDIDLVPFSQTASREDETASYQR